MNHVDCFDCEYFEQKMVFSPISVQLKCRLSNHTMASKNVFIGKDALDLQNNVKELNICQLRNLKINENGILI